MSYRVEQTKRNCISTRAHVLFRMKISVLWFCQCKVLYRKPGFSGCKWFIVIYDLPSSFQFPYLDQHCSSDLELVFIVSSGYAIKGKGIQSFSTHSRFVPNHFVTSPTQIQPIRTQSESDLTRSTQCSIYIDYFVGTRTVFSPEFVMYQKSNEWDF